MSPEKDNDANKDQNGSDSGDNGDNGDGDDKKKDQGDSGSDDGSGKKTSEGGDGKEEKLTKEDIQNIVKESIASAVKDVITPEIDRRISGASKTIYKKVGIKDDQGDDDKNVDLKKSEKKTRVELINVYAKSALKEKLGKVDPEIGEISDQLVGIEIGKLNLDGELSNEEFGNQVSEKVAKSISTVKEKIETSKVEALKKAGQVIDIGTGEKKKTPKDDFEAGKKLAEKRHPKKDSKKE